MPAAGSVRENPGMTGMPPMIVHRTTIAIVDDDHSVRKALSRQLSVAGYHCESFESAEDLLFCLATLEPQGVLSDIHLGGMNGLQLATHPEVTRRQLPVVLMTALPDPMFEEPARQVAAGFLVKPISGEDLLSAIVDKIGPPLRSDD
jgi:FixJ family two-component response regulator